MSEVKRRRKLSFHKCLSEWNTRWCKLECTLGVMNKRSELETRVQIPDG